MHKIKRKPAKRLKSLLLKGIPLSSGPIIQGRGTKTKLPFYVAKPCNKLTKGKWNKYNKNKQKIWSRKSTSEATYVHTNIEVDANPSFACALFLEADRGWRNMDRRLNYFATDKRTNCDYHFVELCCCGHPQSKKKFTRIWSAGGRT